MPRFGGDNELSVAPGSKSLQRTSRRRVLAESLFAAGCRVTNFLSHLHQKARSPLFSLEGVTACGVVRALSSVFLTSAMTTAHGVPALRWASSAKRDARRQSVDRRSTSSRFPRTSLRKSTRYDSRTVGWAGFWRMGGSHLVNTIISSSARY